MCSKVIILVGTSSSGKTSLAKALNSLSSEHYYLSVDDFLNGVPESFIVPFGSPDVNNAGAYFILSEDQKNIIDYTLLPKGYFFQKRIYAAVAALSQAPVYVIFDTFLMDDQIVKIAAAELANHETFFVGVYCAEEKRKEREEKRDTPRMPGIYKVKADYIYKECQYDFIVDTTNQTALEAAKEVLRMCDSTTPSVFKNLISNQGTGEKN